MGFFGKKNQGDGLEDYEEIHEKKTTGLGYFMILLMAVFMIIVGETVFSDLKRVPARPVAPAYCIEQITNTSYSKGSTYRSYPPEMFYGGRSNCSFGATDKRFGLDVIYQQIEPSLKIIADYSKEINNLNGQVSSAQSQIRQLESDYNLSLQEKMAGEQVLFNQKNIQSRITAQRSAITGYQGQISVLEDKKDAEEYKIQPQITQLTDRYKEALTFYERQVAVYKAKTFGLMLLFVLPFFLVSLNRYFALKRKNSQYTIIATGIMVASSFLFFQIVLTFLYDILPKEWLATLFRIFTQVPFFRYVLYYGSALLVIAIFGGIVYIIQKKIFDPKRVAVRRIKENKCPKCSFKLNDANDFCPHCGLGLKEQCGSCGNKRMVHLNFCSSCGKTKGASIVPPPVRTI
jgi:hypothetical protein